ncbi:MAG TPA: lysophospholipid acyltransferase family protein [Thermoanaerobaculia bacterium]|nr:lysophospholipid acyltransferase family protein [Thermoanaerobaculia bacterium]
MRRDLGTLVIPPLAALLIRTLHATLRVRHVHAERIERLNRSAGSYVFSFWHAHLLVMVYARFRWPLTVMISQHRDGELIARTMARFGVRSARGSSSKRGSEAFRDMIRAAREGDVLILTPDGPRGPRRIAQPGVVRAAQMARIPIIPAAVVAEHRKTLPSWDRFEIPMPFSRTIFLYGEPVTIPRDLDAEDLERWREEIERRMNALVEEGERDFDRLWSGAPER